MFQGAKPTSKILVHTSFVRSEGLEKRKFPLRGRGCVLASLANEIKTILADPFINVLDGELNNLKDNHVRDILIEVLGD